MGEVDGGMARTAEQYRMWPGAAVERKAGRRHGGARSWSSSDTAVIFLKEITAPEGKQIKKTL
jgi:hypothetical protein